MLRAVLAMLALALVCSPAKAQSSSAFVVAPCVTATGGGSNQVPYCSPVTSSNPLPISGSFSATLAGWQPTPSYSQLAASDALNHSVAVPSGPDDVVMNLDTNVVYCNAGAAATTNTYPIQPGSAVAWHNPGGTTFTTVQCLSPTSTLKVTIAGGTGLWTAAGGGGSGGGTFTWPGTAGVAVGGTSPTTGTMPYVNSVLIGVNGSGTFLPVIMSATQGVKVSLTDLQSNAGTPNGTVASIQGNASGVPVPMSAASLPLPTGAATAGNQTNVQSAPGTPQTTAVTIQGNASGVPVPISGTVSASFSGFNSGGVYATPLAVSTTSASVAAPAGATVVVFNTGTVAAFTTIHATSATATTAMDQISPGGCWAYVQTGSEFVAGITASGTSTLNISGGSGWPVGCGGGGGSSSIPVTNAGTSATTAAAIQGVTGGVPMPVNSLFIPTGTPKINISTATTTQLVAAVAGKSIYVTSWDVAAASGNFTLEYGTQTTNPCDTGTTTLTGAYTMNGGQFGKGVGTGVVLAVPTGNELCAVTTAAVQYSGGLSYVQQ